MDCMFYTTDLHRARLVKVLIVNGLLVELEVDQVAVVGPGAELECALLRCNSIDIQGRDWGQV